MTVKTNAQLADDVVKSTLGLLSLMKPETQEQIDSFLLLATRMVEIAIKDHVAALVEDGIKKASEAMENK